MSYTETVREALETLLLLADEQRVVDLDSLTTVDLITELEKRTALTIPMSAIRTANFRTVATINAMLCDIARVGGRASQ